MSACLYCAEEEEETANSRNAADDEIIEGYVLGVVVGHTAGVSLVGREEEEPSSMMLAAAAAKSRQKFLLPVVLSFAETHTKGR